MFKYLKLGFFQTHEAAWSVSLITLRQSGQNLEAVRGLTLRKLEFWDIYRQSGCDFTIITITQTAAHTI